MGPERPGRAPPHQQSLPGSERARLDSIFRAALAAVDPAAAVEAVLDASGPALAIAGRPLAEGARIVSLAIGKAAVPMAQALERVAGARISAGLAITADGHGVSLERFSLREVAHPVPDERCETAAREALALASSAAADDVFVLLLSGGASSLSACPAPGLTLRDFARTSQLLMEAGADIVALNAVRKHLSAFSGGRLARVLRCSRVEVLAISDVRGDRFDVIGSGPLAGDPTTYADGLLALRALGLEERVPERVRSHLLSGDRGEIGETLKPEDPALVGVHETLLATNRTARQAALEAARTLGLRGVDLGEALFGEARTAGGRLAGLRAAVELREPLLLVAGGETTVTVRGAGRGGRSQELALSAALRLDGCSGVSLLAAGTDGIDGPTDAAGAFVDGKTLERARAARLDARAFLDDNDAYAFFRAEGGLYTTGPTRTNVMDLALLQITERG